MYSKMSNHLQNHMNVQRWHGELRTIERDAGKEADLRLFAVTLTHQIRSCIKLECRRPPRPQAGDSSRDGPRPSRASRLQSGEDSESSYRRCEALARNRTTPPPMAMLFLCASISYPPRLMAGIRLQEVTIESYTQPRESESTKKLCNPIRFILE